MTAHESVFERTAAHEKVVIRAMTPCDIRASRAIEREAYGALAPHTAFQRELANGLTQYLVAELVPLAGVDSIDVLGMSRRVRLRMLLSGLLPRSLRKRLCGWWWWSGHNDPKLVGFVGVWFTREQLHLVTIAVAPGWQRCGIAVRLLLRCVDLAEEAALSSIALEVRPNNTGARSLYERFGLREIGRLRGYYLDTGEDAVLMLSPPLDDPTFRERIGRLRERLKRDSVYQTEITETER